MDGLPLPALIPALVSMLTWIGIDLGISWLTKDGTNVTYISGLDFSQFIEYCWLPLLLYFLMVVSAIAVAIPKYTNDGRGVRY